MEDGNDANVNNETLHGSQFSNVYHERLGKLTSNGHDPAAETSNPSSPYEPRRPHVDAAQDEKCRQRINPLRIHLGKRPFVENSLSYSSASKRKKPYVVKHNDTSVPKNNVPRVPKLIPKRAEHGQFHKPKFNVDSMLESERDKPVPRLVPKSHLSQYKKGKIEKAPQLKEYAQSLGLQPMVKFKCRKCCSMSFKTLAMLKEHQLICRAQPKELTPSPEATYTESKQNTSGPSRVTRKVYLCSACGTYYENWNLFLHMREVHNRHICLFCLGMFSKAEKLSSHLTNKHDVQEFNFSTKEEFSQMYDGTFYLMCCACDEICCEKDDYFNHDCNNVKPKPVPVLVSKRSLKSNKLKSGKQDNGNGVGIRGSVQTLCDKKILNETKPEATTPSQDIFSSKNISDSLNCDTSVSSMNSSESINRTANDSVDSIYEKDEDNDESITSCQKYQVTSVAQNLSNGDEHKEHDEDSDSHIPSREPVSTAKPKLIVNHPTPPQLPIEKEKEVGIKLKLSLNNANSPVIINSTVDPTVGQNYAHKPPSRNRRPPKRYEKDKPLDVSVPVKQPSIKMTICDRADSPFVKTTIYENNQETIVKTLINNNIEPASIKPSDNKTDSTIKSTIYDNKFDDENTLNRVPKLTVRVPKEFLDKDSSSDDTSDSDASEKLMVDDQNITVEHENEKVVAETSLLENQPLPSNEPLDETFAKDDIEKNTSQPEVTEEEKKPNEIEMVPEIEPKCGQQDIDVTGDVNVEETEPIDEIPLTELTLDRPLDKYPLKDLLKVFLSSTIFNCIYCNHGRVIAVNCEQLALHMVAQHRFSATVDSITAEELMPETIIAKLKSGAEDLNTVYINLDTYDSEEKCEKMTFNQLFECFQCYFKTAVHKELCLHNRKMHQKTILLCVMCKNNFYTYSELICHLCPGTYDSEYEIRYRCCFCSVDTIASSFRLMVHLRKMHHTCDVCLEFCQSQARLSNHVWKHKLHHFCYRCGIAYRNKPDINNHLFWKHGTESVSCKKCLQKKWPHVYHFCNPPAVFVCDECTLQFSRAVCLKVHKRFHSEEYPHPCTEENCTEKFVSKKLLNKHLEEHRKKMFTEDLNEEKPSPSTETLTDEPKEPVVDLVDEKPKDEIDTKTETATDQVSKKGKKKKIKEKDALLLEVDLPALNLSESDSSDESDSGHAPAPNIDKVDATTTESNENEIKHEANEESKVETKIESIENPLPKEDKIEPIEEKPSEQTVLDIWDNFQKHQAKVEKPKEKTPPLVLIKKHVCESDHDYCLVPTNMNGDEGIGSDKKKNKKMKKRLDGLSSSSSSSSDSDSSCSCGSNCSCSSSSGSSSSSSSDSDSSDESGNEKKRSRQHKKSISNRRLSNGSNVDVMGMSETPILAPEKIESPIAETDLETDESETDEEFYDKNPQSIANKTYNEKRNQLMHSASEGGSVSANVSRCTTPIKEEGIQQQAELNVSSSELPKDQIKTETNIKDKSSSSKKKSKKKKKSKSSRKHGPIKINIPKDIIRAEPDIKESQPLAPNKITISLQSNTVQLPEPPKPTTTQTVATPTSTALEKKRSSKRRRVPNKFYGYSSDEENPNPVMSALKPTLPPKLEWRKEDLPSPVTHKTKKETPSMVPQKLFNFNDSLRFSAPPAPDPEPPLILMNSESLESSDSDSSDEGALQIHQPSAVQNSIPVPPPTYLNSGTSSLPYAFQRPPVRQAREGESVYCYCRCPYDEVSEMIACDAEGCPIEWFHFECVGIMVPPKGKWYCPECRKNQSFSGYR